MPTLLSGQIDTLAAFAPTELPVISLYLNTQSDDHGRDHLASFVKKELHTRAGTLAPQSPAHASDSEAVELLLGDYRSGGLAVVARQTGARFKLIEDATLLAAVGGAVASLRYRN